MKLAINGGVTRLSALMWREYINKTAFQEAPFTTSMEWFEYIKKVTPDSLLYVLTDMFETITLYDNTALKATGKKMENGNYLIKFSFETKKLKADSIGNEQEVKMKDLITFGVFDKNGDQLYLGKHWVRSELSEIEILVDEVPATVGIDPYFYLIDKNIDNNVINVKVN